MDVVACAGRVEEIRLDFDYMSSASARVRSEYLWLRSWLFTQALPLWWERGADRKLGGFFEKLDAEGRPVPVARRTRVVGRQIYVYAAAQRMGWEGPSQEVVEHGLKFLLRVCRRDDGIFYSAVMADGAVIRREFDLYDQAFALFGMAAAASVREDGAELRRLCDETRDAVLSGWSHPAGGFEESVPRTLPLKSNPHMHMLEACLAWAEVAKPPHNGPWLNLADQIAELSLGRFLEPTNGCLREFFDGEWKPMSGDEGRIVEPGHQYEWAWLLFRWGRWRNRHDAIEAARRLVDVAEDHGIAPQPRMAMNELWDDLSPKDRDFRLWPQVERIKAWVARSLLASSTEEREAALGHATEAAAGLRRFLTDVAIPGLWHERMDSTGRFKQEPSPASSLYHLVCGISEMKRMLNY